MHLAFPLIFIYESESFYKFLLNTFLEIYSLQKCARLVDGRTDEKVATIFTILRGA